MNRNRRGTMVKAKTKKARKTRRPSRKRQEKGLGKKMQMAAQNAVEKAEQFLKAATHTIKDKIV